MPGARAAAAAPVEPDVIVDFVFDRGLLWLSLENLSDRPALKVSTTFDKPFRGLGGARDMTTLRLLKNVEFLAPRKAIRTLVDSTGAYFARREPAKLTATIAWRTTGGERRRATIVHDLSIYRELAYPTEGATR
jgi:hypothetical protein